VGGLLRPPVARLPRAPVEAVEVLEAVDAVAPASRRVAVVPAGTPGRFTVAAAFVSPLALVGASGEVAGSEGAGVDSAEGVIGAASDCATGTFSMSDMVRFGQQIFVAANI
jgi:hypothetical protein